MVKLRRIDEAKQVGTLYHVCSPKAALWNLKNNKIAPGEYANTRRGKKTVSFSRDSKLIVDTVSRYSPIFFQFVLDGDKISEKKKISPYAAQDYQDYSSLEKEEVIEGSLDDLKSYLKKVIMFLDVDATLLQWSKKEYYIPSINIEILEFLKDSGIQTEILSVNNKSDLTKARTNLPKDLSSVIELFKKVNSYDSKAIATVLYNLSNRFFAGDKKGGSVKINTKPYYHLIDVEFNDPLPNIVSFKDEVRILEETIQEQLESKGIVVTSKKVKDGSLGRHSDYKLNTILNNKTYILKDIIINPYFDYLYNSYPYITLDLVNSKGSDLSFTVYFPV